MSKTILIFSDGTGQIGGLKPDQRLSNIYKMYRAMRPGPDSPIDPKGQTAFYDAGLGSEEARPFTIARFRKVMEGAAGTGIDENIIDCFSAIIADYSPGDKVCLFGFSRGAYTVRALANVMNLCGVPMQDGCGGPVPRQGPKLRAIAKQAVDRVYNHGAGASRAAYEDQRNTLAGRFRRKFGSDGLGADGEGQGNVQPYFIGVFDTVAALQIRAAAAAVLLIVAALASIAYFAFRLAPVWIGVLASVPVAYVAYRFFVTLLPIKTFVDDRSAELPWWHPRRLWAEITSARVDWWSGKHYDRYVDREIRYLRQASSIDEDRERFPRVGWGSSRDAQWNAEHGRADWQKQTWFAGNHSDIGGSYSESESRLSDIALEWMVQELTTTMGTQITILRDRLVAYPDPEGLQHSEIQSVLDSQPRWLRAISFGKLTWRKGMRTIDPAAPLHSSVIARLKAAQVPQMGENKPYRPASLAAHTAAVAAAASGFSAATKWPSS